MSTGPVAARAIHLRRILAQLGLRLNHDLLEVIAPSHRPCVVWSRSGARLQARRRSVGDPRVLGRSARRPALCPHQPVVEGGGPAERPLLRGAAQCLHRVSMGARRLVHARQRRVRSRRLDLGAPPPPVARRNFAAQPAASSGMALARKSSHNAWAESPPTRTATAGSVRGRTGRRRSRRLACSGVRLPLRRLHRGAAGHHVVPAGRAALGARHHVVESELAAIPAVHAAVAVAEEHVLAREGDPHRVSLDEAMQPHHRRRLDPPRHRAEQVFV